MKLGMQVGLGPGHTVRWGPSSIPLPQRGTAPISGPCLLWPNGWMKMPLGTEVCLGPATVRWGVRTQLPLPRKGAEPPPKFLAHVHCGQTVGYIKMAHGMEVGLGAGHIVLDGDPASLPKKGAYSARLLRPNGWMHQDAT